MDNEVVELNELTEKALKELRDFDENEAYFLLCEIFAHAQATKNYTQFQYDLNEWKKRYPVHLFSENYKSKIKYMLSNEFLDTILKNFIAFDELSKKDPYKGLEKLRKVLDKAEKHKDEKKLDKDLDSLYSEYPLSYLKEKYPHIVPQLISSSNRKRILEKFDSSDAFKELDTIVSKPDNFDDANMFKEALEEWQRIYPLDNFNDEYKKQVEQMLTNSLTDENLEKLFSNLDLSNGLVIPIESQGDLENIDAITKNALFDLFKIIDANKYDINSLFSWTCEYGKHINSFDENSKNIIIENLLTSFGNELPPKGSNFKIPEFDNMEDDLLSLSNFENINNIKKETIIQFLGIIYSGAELTTNDKHGLGVIMEGAKKAKTIEKARISDKLDVFMDMVPEEKLTDSDELYLNTPENEELEISTPEDDNITIDDTIQIKSEDASTPVTDAIVDNNSAEDSFKENLKVEGIEMQKVETSSNSSDASSGSTGGGVSNSLGLEEAEVVETKDDELEENDDKDDKKEEDFTITPIIIETSGIKIDEKQKTNLNIVEEKEENQTQPEIDTDITDNNTANQDIIKPKTPKITDDNIVLKEPNSEPEPIFDNVQTSSQKKHSSETEEKSEKSFFERLFRNDDDDGRDL